MKMKMETDLRETEEHVDVITTNDETTQKLAPNIITNMCSDLIERKR